MTPADSLAARVQQASADWGRTLRRWPWMDTLRTLRQRFREDRLALTAGSLTFTTVISLVPLMTVALALFTAFPVFATFQAALEKYLLQALVPQTIARPVLDALTQFAGKASRVGSVGLITLVLAALALMITIDRTLNALWRVRQPRPLAQRVLVYWAALTLGPLLLGISLTLTSYAVSASRGLVQALPGGVSALFGAVEFGLLAGGTAGLFHYVPNTHVRWTHAWAGGVFVAAGIELAQKGLGWYLHTVPSYSMIYGAFASVPIMLLWVYLTWVIVLLGAVVAAYAPSLSLHVRRLPDRPGLRFALALAVLRALAQARQGTSRGLSALQLAGAVKVDPLQLEPIVEALTEMDWVGRIEEAGDQRHVLLADPATTLAEPLLRSLLLADAEAARPFEQRIGLQRLTLADLLA